MANFISVKRMVFVYLILHTAAIAAIAALLRADLPLGGPLLAAALVIACAALTFFTAERILRHVREGVAQSFQGLLQYTTQLQAVSEHLDEYAKELGEYAKSAAPKKDG